MAEPEKRLLPPYFPYKTFGTFLTHLRTIGMPSHIDKSVMASMSGGMQSWLKSGLRYMRLIDASDAPTERLDRLVSSEGEARRQQMLELFNDSYAFLNGKIDLRNTTPPRLREAINELGAQGETTEKIVAFLVALAKEAGVPLSPLLTKRAPSVRRNRAKNGKAGARTVSMNPADLVDDDEDETLPAPSMKTVKLPKAGGSITLSGDVNLFSLVGAERALVFALIDKMSEFEEAQGEDDA